MVDEIDMFAINLTLMHWGISAWCVYLVVTVAMGLATFRFSLPMTFRSCFYPIIGEYAWGWIGDVLDGFTLVTTVSGVCTRYVCMSVDDRFAVGLVIIDADSSKNKFPLTLSDPTLSVSVSEHSKLLKA